MQTSQQITVNRVEVFSFTIIIIQWIENERLPLPAYISLRKQVAVLKKKVSVHNKLLRVNGALFRCFMKARFMKNSIGNHGLAYVIIES